MSKVIKIIVSDKFFSDNLSGDASTLADKNVSFTEGMTRLVLGEHFKDVENIEINTDDVRDESSKRILRHGLFSCLTCKLSIENGKDS